MRCKQASKQASKQGGTQSHLAQCVCWFNSRFRGNEVVMKVSNRGVHEDVIGEERMNAYPMIILYRFQIVFGVLM